MNKILILLGLLREFLIWIATLSVISFLFSCSPLRRLERFEKRHPYLFNREIDTLRVTDTVTVPGVRSDTAVNLQNLHDTVTIIKDQLRVQVWYDKDTDTVYISGECEPFEIVRELSVPYTKNVIYRRARDGLIWGIVIVSFLCLIELLFIIYLLKRKKPG